MQSLLQPQHLELQAAVPRAQTDMDIPFSKKLDAVRRAAAVYVVGTTFIPQEEIQKDSTQ